MSGEERKGVQAHTGGRIWLQPTLLILACDVSQKVKKNFCINTGVASLDFATTSLIESGCILQWLLKYSLEKQQWAN